MAEKYGTVPKKFTKAWWSWYWMYHKGITLGAIFAIILIVITIVDYATKERYDITLTFASESYCSDTTVENMEKILSPMCEDLDGNGEKSLFFSQFYIDFESTDAEYLQATMLKIDMAIGEDSTYLFIVDEAVAKRYIGEEKKDCSFAPLKDWVTGDISNFQTYDAHDTAYGIDISTLDIFKEAGINPASENKHYMFMRYYPRKDQLDDHKAGYEASINLANKILEYKAK